IAMTIRWIQFGNWYGENLGINATLVFNFYNTQCAAFYHCTYGNRARCEYEYVNGVAVLGESLGHIAIVAGIMHSCQHESIYMDGPSFFVNLIFNWIRILRNLNNNVEFLWCVFTRCDLS